MNYGDGDGITFGPYSSAIDVVAHEITHEDILNLVEIGE